jgi:hypothetical protein
MSPTLRKIMSEPIHNLKPTYEPQFVHVGVSYGFSRQLSAMMVALGCISEIWSVLFVERKQPRQLRSKHETPVQMGMDVVTCTLCGEFASRCGCDV